MAMQYRDLSDKLSFGGQPTAEELRELAKKGVKTVINVRDPNEEQVHIAAGEEKALVESLGMTYVNIPVTAQTINEESAGQVMGAIAGAKSEGPVFVH